MSALTIRIAGALLRSDLSGRWRAGSLPFGNMAALPARVGKLAE